MTGVYLRLGAAVLALGAGAAAIVVAVLLLRATPGPVSTSSSPISTSSSSGPAPPTSIAGGRMAVPDEPSYPSPPPDALVLSREAGTNALALAIKGNLVRVSVVSGAGPGKAGLDVRVGSTKLAACGRGCYQATLAAPHGRLVVSLGGKDYSFDLPARTSDATSIMAHSGKTWRALTSLVWHERLASSPTLALDTTYEAIAPDELAYQTKGDGAAVILGGKRWDRAARGPWVPSVQQPPVRQPVPYWQTAPYARVIASTTFQAHPVWRISFFDPHTPAWFTADVDKRTYRTLELDMIAAAHFMHHVYGPFDAPITIKSPA